MGIFSWICLGILAGLFANRVGVIPNIFLKGLTYVFTVGGAILGGFIGIQQGWAWGDITSFNILSFTAAIVGVLIAGGLYFASVYIASRSKNHQKIL